MATFLIAFVLAAGILYLRLHHLPEHLAHKSQKIQYEIVGVLGLLAMFTHVHAFWIAGLLLAFIDIPDFGTPLGRISSALERMATHRRERIAVKSLSGTQKEKAMARSPAGASREGEPSTTSPEQPVRAQ